MKVRSSVKPICEKCKVIKRKGRSELSVRIPSTSRDRVNSILLICMKIRLKHIFKSVNSDMCYKYITEK